MKIHFCSECKNSECEDFCDPNSTACHKFVGEKITEGDLIRQMSNAELAHLFANACPPGIEKHCGGNDREQCERCWLEYLNRCAKNEWNGR